MFRLKGKDEVISDGPIVKQSRVASNNVVGIIFPPPVEIGLTGAQYVEADLNKKSCSGPKTTALQDERASLC